MPIKVLDPKVVSRIAAGEVVERPASVVKELVENSLDAGAAEIIVETQGSGISLIRVTDNGIGIPSREFPILFQRHATSKINKIEDLESILTLGFRGEALPSIASVSDVEMVTRFHNDDIGSFVRLADGAVTEKGSRARETGTTVAVRNLFRRVPARLKFLKSPATENARIANVLSRYALAYPEIRFTLISDGRVALRTNGNGRLIDAVAQVYGVDIASKMIDIGEATEKDGTSVIVATGMAGKPEISRATADYMSFFVNRRWVISRMLLKAVEEAYHGLLMTGKHPVAIINVSISPKEVDVNIHPAKTEIKFRNERAIFGLVQKAVRQALIARAPVHQIKEPTAVYNARKLPFFIEKKTLEMSAHALPGVQSPTTKEQGYLQETPRTTLPVLRILGQASNSYIVAEGPDGVYLIDQHAAHERVLFERISEQRMRRALELQWLLTSETLEVASTEDIVLKAGYEGLKEFGFSLEPFGSRTYLVRTIPAMLNGKDWRTALREIIDALSSEGKAGYAERIIISLACHGAVKAGDRLSDIEMEELVKELSQTSLPNTCPHGRPTLIKMNYKELEKEFERI